VKELENAAILEQLWLSRAPAEKVTSFANTSEKKRS